MRIKPLFHFLLLLCFSLHSKAQLFNPTGKGIMGSSQNIFSLDTADMDGDGLTDILCAKAYLGAQWHKNLGGGTYATARTFVPYIRSARPYDLDKDGDLDILSFHINGLNIYMNDGYGNFEDSLIIDPNAYGLTDAIAFDADVDGDLDILAVSYYYDRLMFYENLAYDSFSAPDTLTESIDYPISVLTGDFNGDTLQDILVASYLDEKVYGFTNMGDSFSTEYSARIGLERVQYLAKGDYDQDGDLDFSCVSGRNLFWFENDGGGIFSLGANLLYSNYSLRTIHSVDFDHDGELDIIYTANDTLGLYLNNGGNFFPREVLAVGNYHNQALRYDLARVADMDGDGDYDVMGGGFNNKIAYRKNTGKLNGWDEQIINGYDYDGLLNHRWHDMDGDGDEDLVYSTEDFGKIAWHQFEGGGHFGSRHLVYIPGDSAPYMWSRDITVGDLNGDSLPDMVVALAHGQTSERTDIFYNLGNDSFGMPLTLDTVSIKPISPNMFIEDLDGDSLNDILINDHRADSLVWYKNFGNDSFSQRITLWTSGYLWNQTELADLDGDGDKDIILAKLQLGWMENLGGGAFSSEKLISDTFANYEKPVLHDLDQDGDLDIVAASYSNKCVFWIEQLAKDSFSVAHVLSDTSGKVSRVAVADFDLDGDADIACYAQEPHQIMWFEQLKSDSFSAAQRIQYSSSILYYSNAVHLTAKDMDGDIDIDLLFSTRTNSYWLENLTAYPLVSGSLYYDLDGNGQKDMAEQGLGFGQLIAMPDSVIIPMDDDGRYSFEPPKGSFSLRVDTTSMPHWKLSSDSSVYSLIIGDTTKRSNLDFGFEPDGIHNDLKINLHLSKVICNKESVLSIDILNEGNNIINDTLWVKLDSRITDTSYVDHPDTSVGKRRFGWYIQNLYPGKDTGVSVIVRFPGPSSQFVIGDRLLFESYMDLPNTSGADTFIKRIEPQVFCSPYVANQKSSQPMRGGQNYTLDNERIVYTIQFENTGTDTLNTISALDTLDASLNLSSLRFLGAGPSKHWSHQLSGRILSLRMDSLQLTPSSASLTESQGYFLFDILPQGDLPNQTEIRNRARITLGNQDHHSNQTLNTILDTIHCGSVDTTELQTCDSVLFP